MVLHEESVNHQSSYQSYFGLKNQSNHQSDFGCLDLSLSENSCADTGIGRLLAHHDDQSCDEKISSVLPESNFIMEASESELNSDPAKDFRWFWLALRLVKRTSVRSGLETDALSRLASVENKVIQDTDSEDASCILKKSEKLDLAVDTYRQLPLIIRARLENWRQQRAQVWGPSRCPSICIRR